MKKQKKLRGLQRRKAISGYLFIMPFILGFSMFMELFNLRFQNATNQLDNTSRIKEVRRNIARIQTVITEKAN